jgi:ribosomal protein L20
MKRKRLLRKRRRRKIWIKWLKSSNKRYQQRCSDFLDAGEGNTHTINIKYLEQTARNFTTFSDRKILT